MAHKKGAGSTKNGRDSNAKRLGVKVVGGKFIHTGQIIIRQRGYSFHAGNNIGIGRDYTLFALKDGYVSYTSIRGNKKKVSIEVPNWENLINLIGYSSWKEFQNTLQKQ
ncbi:50S ribosomal protein L27 (chloroplast) [Nannochloropsis gaditana]|uniref:Large ribosomal subunit protein bL27c n=1 Tax=Nannochloropsis gaditana TaxID=72520 RepID=K9ZWH1_9STRA|nr:50S ribosomal protein L27 [Nannochloropsis gaditana]AFZ64290.1 50S ribosomal protein L27 [Nannochloropsis gaditana]AGI98661.1 ribosomal protein L27 [Nannochloropsis gaditana]AHX25055.1 50S ribosomal protein L27 [Nannochloropsis gaditana]